MSENPEYGPPKRTEPWLGIELTTSGGYWIDSDAHEYRSCALVIGRSVGASSNLKDADILNALRYIRDWFGLKGEK